MNAYVPQVTIAMPAHNAESTIGAAIRSIILQTWRDWELLVIDDGSTDSTRQVVAGFNDPRVRLIADGANLGLAARLNQTIRMSRAPLFARMDADDIAYPWRLEAQVKFLEVSPECDLVGCGALIFDTAGGVVGRFPFRRTHAEICRNPWRGFYLPHPTWMGRHEWFAKFGYLESYRKAQDQDLLLRSFDTSSFACIDRTLLGYRQDRRAIGKSLQGRSYFSRSIAREALRRRSWGMGVSGVVVQAIKATADLLTVPFGMDGWLRGSGGAAMSASELEEWETIWKACNMDLET